jgi:hypothetical protein
MCGVRCSTRWPPQRTPATASRRLPRQHAWCVRACTCGFCAKRASCGCMRSVARSSRGRCHAGIGFHTLARSREDMGVDPSCGCVGCLHFRGWSADSRPWRCSEPDRTCGCPHARCPGSPNLSLHKKVTVWPHCPALSSAVLFCCVLTLRKRTRSASGASLWLSVPWRLRWLLQLGSLRFARWWWPLRLYLASTAPSVTARVFPRRHPELPAGAPRGGL